MFFGGLKCPEASRELAVGPRDVAALLHSALVKLSEAPEPGRLAIAGVSGKLPATRDLRKASTRRRP